jgi:hypothetical protein
VPRAVLVDRHPHARSRHVWRMSASHGLQSSQGAPAPQSQASNRLLNILKGRSGWFSQTQPVLSQVSHAMAPAPRASQCGGGAGVIAFSLLRQNVGKVAHVNPATTGGALDEMLPLVLEARSPHCENPHGRLSRLPMMVLRGMARSVRRPDVFPKQ